MTVPFAHKIGQIAYCSGLDCSPIIPLVDGNRGGKPHEHSWADVFCGAVSFADTAAVYAPDSPIKLQWTRFEPVALELPLSAPSRHRLASPRGPPLA